MSQTKLHLYCLFGGASLSLPFGNSEYYKRASELALSLVEPSGRTGSDSEEEIFYLETAEQLTALFDFQKQPEIRNLILAQRAEDDEQGDECSDSDTPSRSHDTSKKNAQ